MAHNFLGDTLNRDVQMTNGTALRSASGTFFLVMQADGNLVGYSGQNFTAANAFWSSNTYGKGRAPFRCVMQTDGNFVVYDAANTATWHSNTYLKGQAPHRLVMQDDRNIVIYDARNTATWSSNTYQAPQRASGPVQAPNVIDDTLRTNVSITSGQYIASMDRRVFLAMQTDGNLVAYRSTDFVASNAIWSSNTYGKGMAPYTLTMQGDGNLVIYDAQRKPTWASDTWNKGAPGHRLVAQDDMNIVVYDGAGKATWASNTNQSFPMNKAHRMCNVDDTLATNMKLPSNSYIKSKNNKVYLVMQNDGNLVLYTNNAFTSNFAIWSSGTHGKGSAPYTLDMQSDGNLVVYDRNRTATWASNTWNKGTPGHRLVVQEDCNVVIYDGSNTPTWASNTNR